MHRVAVSSFFRKALSGFSHYRLRLGYFRGMAPRRPSDVKWGLEESLDGLLFPVSRKKSLFNGRANRYYIGMNLFSNKNTVAAARFRTFVRAVFLFACFAMIAGCSRTGSGKADDVQGSGDALKVRAPRHKPADHRILVMLGPGFTGRAALLQGLTEEYGLYDPALPDSPGMMTVLSWPDSFIVEKRPRLTVLKDSADDSAITVIVTIGAPEGTVRELTRIRAAHPEKKIVTLFAEDSGLPLEAVSDVLLDRTAPSGVLADEASLTAASLSDQELGLLLLGATLSAEDRDSTTSPLTKVSVSLDAARNLMKLKGVGQNWLLSAYIDPDTALRSRNHLTVEIPLAAVSPGAGSPGASGAGSTGTGASVGGSSS